MAAIKSKDRRIERTREAIAGAFIRLMFDGKRYDRITVADLIARAGVGRSTFYEHYRNKEDVLAETIRYPFAPLAESVDRDFDVARLRGALAHFRENRVQGNAVFAGAARRAVSRVLASMIEERLARRAKQSGLASAPAIAIAATALADGQLAAIVAWLGNGDDEAQVAAVLHRIAQGMAREICGE